MCVLISAKPSFGLGQYEILTTSIKENTPVNHTFYRIHFSGVVGNYTLHPFIVSSYQEGRSMIAQALGVKINFESNNLELYLKKALDFEAFKVPHHKTGLDVYFEIGLVQPGQTKPSTKAKVYFRLFITDVNDNSPEFTGSIPHMVSINATEPVGSEVVRLTATDADHGENGLVH